MTILIVYDSVFGNTGMVAHAIADALSPTYQTKLLPVHTVTDADLQDVDLLIVGSPTRGFHPTPAIHEFVCRPDLPGSAAAFDTRLDLDAIEPAPLRWVINAGGYAAERLGRALSEHGCTMVGEAAGFVVAGQEGPLKDGELERAAEWARGLVSARNLES